MIQCVRWKLQILKTSTTEQSTMLLLYIIFMLYIISKLYIGLVTILHHSDTVEVVSTAVLEF